MSQDYPQRGPEYRGPEYRTAGTPAAAAPAQAAPVASVQIADPAPLGLAAFAMTTFVLSLFNANLFSASLSAVVLPLALFYGGIAQLLAGMWEFRRGSTFGAVAFSSFGAFWLSFAAYVRFVAPHLPAATANQATGIFLLAWLIFTFYMTFAALRVNLAVTAVFVTLTFTYFFLTLGALLPNTTMTKVGGGIGLATAACAWYAAFAGVMNGTWRRTIIPTWPMETGAISAPSRSGAVVTPGR